MKKFLYLGGIIILLIAITTFLGAYFFNKNLSGRIGVNDSDNSKNAVIYDKDVFLNRNNSATKSIIDLPIGARYVQASEDTVIETDKQKEVNAINARKNRYIKDRALYPKEIFLTFDDGPSENTPKILKILNDNNIKATFFLIGRNAETYPQYVKEEFNDGMCLVAHSYTHDYAIYKSVETYMADLDTCNKSITKITGIPPLSFTRFPGGSDNQVSNADMMKTIRKSVNSRGIDYIDWNISSGDAASSTLPAQTIKNNLFTQLANSTFGVSLMHDAPYKSTTVEALPAVIDYLKKQGFAFRTFDDLTPTEKSTMINLRIMNRGADKQ